MQNIYVENDLLFHESRTDVFLKQCKINCGVIFLSLLSWNSNEIRASIQRSYVEYLFTFFFTKILRTYLDILLYINDLEYAHSKSCMTNYIKFSL